MKSSGYVNGVTGVERSRRFGGEVVLGLNEVQSRLIRVLLNDANDLNARRQAYATLQASHLQNSAVVTILEMHFDPATLADPVVKFPESPR